MVITMTPENKEILDNYDIDKILTMTIPDTYIINSQVLEIYKSKIKRTVPIDIYLSQDNHTLLTSLSNNYHVPISLILNYLLTNVVDLSKINTKKVTHALDFYYEAATSNPDLFKKILDGYSDSIYYNPDIGLSDEGIANFLTLSQEGKNLIKNKKD